MELEVVRKISITIIRLYVQAAILASAFILANAADVCYDDVGCFTTDYPWTDVRRPISNLPQSPDVLNTRFFLYTRNVPAATQITYNGTDLGDFDGTRKTMVIIHGFSDSGRSGWMNSLKDKVLDHWDYNVILVDWELGAQSPYLQATANAQLVGRQVALLAHNLEENGGASVDDMHLIAHSLGCHVCGYAGYRIPGLGRITGLDPAEPYFEDTAPEVHLDPSDAKYVDILHADGREILFIGMGFTKACGHVDFFPNNGRNQPGCGDFISDVAGLIYDLETLDFDAINSLFGCSHARAHKLFIATLTEQCPFIAFPCRNHGEYVSGECQRLKNAHIGRLGVDNMDLNLNGSYYFETTSNESALCMHYLEIELDINMEQVDTHGNLVFRVYGSGGTTDLLPGWASGTEIHGLDTLHTMLHTSVDLQDITAIDVTYHSQSSAQNGSVPLMPAMLRVYRVDMDLKVKVLEMWGGDMEVYDQKTTMFLPLA